MYQRENLGTIEKGITLSLIKTLNHFCDITYTGYVVNRPNQRDGKNKSAPIKIQLTYARSVNYK